MKIFFHSAVPFNKVQDRIPYERPPSLRASLLYKSLNFIMLFFSFFRDEHSHEKSPPPTMGVMRALTFINNPIIRQSLSSVKGDLEIFSKNFTAFCSCLGSMVI